MHRKLFPANLRLFLAVVGSASLVLGAAYTMTQQSTRLSANDGPRINAQLLKRQLSAGASASDAVAALTPIKTDLKTDYAGFVIVTDQNGNIQASSLEGNSVLPPKGVFSYTKDHGSDIHTWQTADGTRIAMVTLAYDNGIIIAGQPLKPYEDRVTTYGYLALAAWIAVLGWSWLTLLLPTRLPAKKP